MPQLDTATFRGQVTWLVVVFGGLYRVRTGEVLPKLSRIVKMRAKKVDRTRGDASQYDGERTQLQHMYWGSLSKSAASSYGLLQKTIEVQTQWTLQQLAKVNRPAEVQKALSTYRSYRMKVNMAAAYLGKKVATLMKVKGKGIRMGKATVKATTTVKRKEKVVAKPKKVAKSKRTKRTVGQKSVKVSKSVKEVKVDTAPKSVTVSKSEAAPKTEKARKVEKAPKAEKAPKVEKAPKAEKAPKSKETSKVVDKVKDETNAKGKAKAEPKGKTVKPKQ